MKVVGSGKASIFVNGAESSPTSELTESDKINDMNELETGSINSGFTEKFGRVDNEGINEEISEEISDVAMTVQENAKVDLQAENVDKSVDKYEPCSSCISLFCVSFVTDLGKWSVIVVLILGMIGVEIFCTIMIVVGWNKDILFLIICGITYLCVPMGIYMAKRPTCYGLFVYWFNLIFSAILSFYFMALCIYLWVAAGEGGIIYLPHIISIIFLWIPCSSIPCITVPCWSVRY